MAAFLSCAVLGYGRRGGGDRPLHFGLCQEEEDGAIALVGPVEKHVFGANYLKLEQDCRELYRRLGEKLLGYWGRIVFHDTLVLGTPWLFSLLCCAWLQ